MTSSPVILDGKFRIVGRLIDSNTNKGIAGLTVSLNLYGETADGWPQETVSLAEGDFSFFFDELEEVTFPDVYFEVCDDNGNILLSTESQVLYDLARGDHEVILNLDLRSISGTLLKTDDSIVLPGEGMEVLAIKAYHKETNLLYPIANGIVKPDGTYKIFYAKDNLPKGVGTPKLQISVLKEDEQVIASPLKLSPALHETVNFIIGTEIPDDDCYYDKIAAALKNELFEVAAGEEIELITNNGGYLPSFSAVAVATDTYLVVVRYKESDGYDHLKCVWVGKSGEVLVKKAETTTPIVDGENGKIVSLISNNGRPNSIFRVSDTKALIIYKQTIGSTTTCHYTTVEIISEPISLSAAVPSTFTNVTDISLATADSSYLYLAYTKTSTTHLARYSLTTMSLSQESSFAYTLSNFSAMCALSQNILYLIDSNNHHAYCYDFSAGGGTGAVLDDQELTGEGTNYALFRADIESSNKAVLYRLIENRPQEARDLQVAYVDYASAVFSVTPFVTIDEAIDNSVQLYSASEGKFVVITLKETTAKLATSGESAYRVKGLIFPKDNIFSLEKTYITASQPLYPFTVIPDYDAWGLNLISYAYASTGGKINFQKYSFNVNADSHKIVNCALAYGLDPLHIAYYVKAHEFSEKEPTLLADMIFGLFMKEITTDLTGLAAAQRGDLEKALSEANNEAIIEADSSKRNTFLDALASYQANRIDGNSDFFIKRLLTLAEVPATGDNHKNLIEFYLQNSENASAFWSGATSYMDANQKNTLQYLCQVALLTGNNMDLTEAIYDSENNYDSLKSLAQITTDELNTLIANNYPGFAEIDALNTEEYPNIDKVALKTEAKARYVEMVENKIELVQPTEYFYQRADASSSSVFTTTLKTNLENFVNISSFDLNSSNIRELNIGQSLGINEAGLLEIENMQRLYRLAPQVDKFDVTLKLLEAGYTSGFSIAYGSRSSFMRAFCGDDTSVETQQQAATVYNNAVRVTMTTLLGMSLSKIANQILPASADMKQFESLESMFGSMDLYDIPHDKSVLGPAAYLVDLLHFLESYKNSEGNAEAFDELIKRRPDITHLKLNSKNTSTLIPYIDIVHEILENAVAGDAYSGNDTISSDEEMLAAYPGYINWDAYTALLGKKFPTAFNYWREELTALMKKLDLPHEKIVELFSNGDTKDMAMAGFGFSEGERLLLQDSETTPTLAITDYYGGSVAANEPILNILSRFQVSYDDLLLLLETTYINPDPKDINYGTEGQPSLSAATINLSGAEIRRMRRFLILQKRTGWSTFELDRIITKLGMPHVAGSIANYFWFKKLQTMTKLSVQELLVWFANMDTKNYDDDLCLYDKLILSKTALYGSMATTFALHSNRIELNSTSLDLAATSDTVTEAKALLTGVLAISMTELDHLIDNELVTTYLNMANISRLYRISSFCKANKLSIQEYYRLHDVAPEDEEGNAVPVIAGFDSGETPYDIYLLMQRHQLFKRLGLHIDAVEYLLTGNYTPYMSNDTETTLVTNTLQKVCEKVKDYHGKANDATDVADIIEEQVATDLKTTKETAASLLSKNKCVYLRKASTAVDESTDIFSSISHSLVNGETLVFNGTSLPSGINASTIYYVIEASADTFKVSTTAQGPAVSITTAGTDVEWSMVSSLVTTTVTANDDTLVSNNHGLVKGNGIVFVGTTLPGGINASTIYYVIDKTDHEFKISATPGGNAIVPSTTGNTVKWYSVNISFMDYFKFTDFWNTDPEDAFTSLEKALATCLLRESLLFNKMGIENKEVDGVLVDEVACVFENFGLSTCINGSDLTSNVVVPILDNMMAAYVFEKDHLQEKASSYKFISGENTPAYRAYLSEITGWSVEHINTLITTFSLKYSLTDATKLLSLGEACSLMYRIGISPDDMALIADDTLDSLANGEKVLSAVKKGLRSKYTPENWSKIYTDIRGTLREQQRKALLDDILFNGVSEGGSGEEVMTINFDSADDVYAYYLIDPEMGPEMKTSRIVQATLAVQLFVQRILLNLERYYTRDAQGYIVKESNEIVWYNITVDNDFSQEWKWRKNYRVWEANRKIFLWPENWIEPELRDDKTQFFKELEEELLQDELTEQSTETAYQNYLGKLLDVSHMEICGLCWDEHDTSTPMKTLNDAITDMPRVPDMLTIPSDERKTLLIFARTKGTPHNYYWRKWINQQYWTGWEKINLDIEGDHLIPYYYNSRLFLMWPRFRPLTINRKDEWISKTTNNDEGENTLPVNGWDISLSWAEYRNGKWNATRTTKQSIMANPDDISMFNINWGIGNSFLNLMNPFARDFRKAVASYWENIPKQYFIFRSSVNSANNYLQLSITCYREYQDPFATKKSIVEFNGPYFIFDEVVNDFKVSEQVKTGSVDQTEWEQVPWNWNIREIDSWNANSPVKYLWFTGLRPDNNKIEGRSSSDSWLDTFLLGTVGDRYHLAFLPTENRTLPRMWEPFTYEDDKHCFFVNPEYDLDEYVGGDANALTARKSDIVNGNILFHDIGRESILVSTNIIGKVAPFILHTSLEMEKTFTQTKPIATVNSRTYYTADNDGEAADAVENKGSYTTAANASRGFGADVTLNTNRRIKEIIRLETDTLVNNIPISTRSYQHKAVNGYAFYAFEHHYVPFFIKMVNRYGVKGLLDPREYKTENPLVLQKGKEYYFAADYNPNPNPYSFVKEGAAITDITNEYIYFPRKEITFESKKPYSIYNWEIFFHAPFFIAKKLMQEQKFEKAQKWFHYIFDPTIVESEKEGDPESKRFWKFGPFAEADVYTLPELMERISDGDDEMENQIEIWEDNPFNPHAIARLRVMAYMKAVVMAYIDNLLGWADGLFRQDTRESINEATQLYILAAQLLGRKPVLIEPPTLLEQTYDSLGALDEFSNAETLTFEGLLMPRLPYMGHKVKKLSYLNDPYQKPGGTSLPGLFLGFPMKTDLSDSEETPELSYFGIPQNEKLLKYWDIVADRLFKIRHSMNIDGVKRQLALFAPPIDPGIFVRAMAAGLSIDDVLSQVFGAPSFPYRFTFTIQKAKEFCNEVKSFGAGLLAALEKKDGEELALLRMKHEIKLQDSMHIIKKKAIDEAVQNLEAVLANKEAIAYREAYYDSRKYMNDAEKAGIGLTIAAEVLRIIASGIKMGASGAAATPDATGGGAGISSPVVLISYGGSQVSSSINLASEFLNTLASGLSTASSLSQTIAGYQRRREDWNFQKGLARKELTQIEKQIFAAGIRLAIAEKDLENFELQMEQSKQIEQTMKEKFTNKELYNWMVTQITGIYFQSYKMAHNLAIMAQECCNNELDLGDDEKVSIIDYGYWNSLHKGLLAGELLMKGLLALELHYMNNNRRQQEITKHVSLALINPEKLMTLKMTGSCEFSIPPVLFDLEYPWQGADSRKIKSVSLTIPCVAGPYTNVPCRLSLTSVTGVTVTGMATSSGRNDSGMFEFNFKDERYLPFEGAKIADTPNWTLELPTDFKPFDYNTISDVIMTVNFTAKNGDGNDTITDDLNDVVDNDQGFPLLINMKEQFPNELHEIQNGTTKTITILEKHYPSFLRNGKVESADDITVGSLYLKLKTMSSWSEVNPTTPEYTITKTNYDLSINPNDGVYANIDNICFVLYLTVS